VDPAARSEDRTIFEAGGLASRPVLAVTGSAMLGCVLYGKRPAKAKMPSKLLLAQPAGGRGRR